MWTMLVPGHEDDGEEAPQKAIVENSPVIQGGIMMKVELALSSVVLNEQKPKTKSKNR